MRYRGTSVIRNTPLLGPYRRPMPRVLGGVLGGWAFSYERGTPVLLQGPVVSVSPRVLTAEPSGQAPVVRHLQRLLESKDTHRPRALR